MSRQSCGMKFLIELDKNNMTHFTEGENEKHTMPLRHKKTKPMLMLLSEKAALFRHGKISAQKLTLSDRLKSEHSASTRI